MCNICLTCNCNPVVMHVQYYTLVFKAIKYLNLGVFFKKCIHFKMSCVKQNLECLRDKKAIVFFQNEKIQKEREGS